MIGGKFIGKIGTNDKFFAISPRFVDQMTVFCEEARSQCNTLQTMAKKMETSYQELAKYFVFEAQKYSLEELMTDLKTFKTQFQVGAI